MDQLGILRERKKKKEKKNRNHDVDTDGRHRDVKTDANQYEVSIPK